MKRAILLGLLLCIVVALPAAANTPGKHSVLLTWQEAGCSLCTYNVYKGTAPNVCQANNGNPTPYQTGVAITQFTDSGVPAGTYYYNVSAVSLTLGGESACSSSEQQAPVPNITTPVPSGTSAQIQ